MRVILPQDELATALGTVARAVSPKHTMPALAGVFLQAENGHLTLRATDLELAMEYTLPAQVHLPGSVVLPARYLTDLVRRIPFGDVEIEVDTATHRATIRWQRSQYVIHGYPPQEFPHLPRPGEAGSVSIPQAALRELLRQTAFAVAHDETRPYLTGVHLTLRGTELAAVATDSVRIAHARTPVENPDQVAFAAIVPGRSLSELARTLSADGEALCHLALEANQIFFSLGQLIVISRLLDGQYPDVLRFIPQTFSTRAIIPRDPFLEALERAAVITREGAVKLSFSAGTLAITAQAPEVGQVYEELPVQVEGDPLEIGFNARYLVEGLKVLDGSEFAFHLTGSRNPGLITPVGDNKNYEYLILPLIAW